MVLRSAKRRGRATVIFGFFFHELVKPGPFTLASRTVRTQDLKLGLELELEADRATTLLDVLSASPSG
jgi:hypothetical protein